MTRVAVIACDHGLGHVRRSVLVARALADRGAEVALLAPPAKVARAEAGLPPAAPVTVVGFDTRTTPEALRSGAAESTRWVERLPELDRFDAVVADTLPEVLEVRPDAVLVAQFWWHDALDGIDAAYREHALALLDEHRGPVLGSVPFAMPAVTALPGFESVGLFASGSGGASSGAVTTERDTLLVTGGSTDVLDGALAALVAGVRSEPGGWPRIAVEARLLPGGPVPADPTPQDAGRDRGDVLVAADFSPAGLDRVGLAVARPGLGIVTELLERGVPILAVREDGNRELSHNAGALESLGAGRDLGVLAGPEDAGRVLDSLRGSGSVAHPPDAGDVVGRPAALALDGARAVAERALGSA